MKILVVEDDPIVATIYSRALDKAGYQVDVIPDGSDAFHALHTKGYDLVLLDIMLPNMDGMAILRRIRAQKKFEFLPIIVITGVQKALQAQILNAGATLVLSKGEVSPQKLVDAVKEQLATAPQPPLELLPDPVAEALAQQRPDLRTQTTPPPSSAPLQLRLADNPDSPPPPKLKLDGLKDPDVKITEDNDASQKKGGFFSRLFGKK
ncbi:MAG: response regulator [Verrucomicrobiae bacterium]|nr:response regulator [Verrucomicrobiae bacterium]